MIVCYGGGGSSGGDESKRFYQSGCVDVPRLEHTFNDWSPPGVDLSLSLGPEVAENDDDDHDDGGDPWSWCRSASKQIPGPKPGSKAADNGGGGGGGGDGDPLAWCKSAIKQIAGSKAGSKAAAAADDDDDDDDESGGDPWAVWCRCWRQVWCRFQPMGWASMECPLQVWKGPEGQSEPFTSA